MLLLTTITGLIILWALEQTEQKKIYLQKLIFIYNFLIIIFKNII